MSPAKVSHLIMAAILVVSGVFLILIGINSNTDFCKTSSSDPNVVNIYFTKPSSSAVNLAAKHTVFLLAMGLFLVAVIPWLRYKQYPDFHDYFNIHQKSGCRIIDIIRAYDLVLLNKDIINLLVYVHLSVFFCVILGVHLNKPDVLLLANPTTVDLNGSSVKCFVGLGAFLWFKTILILICTAFFSLIAILFGNIFVECRRLKRHRSNVDGYGGYINRQIPVSNQALLYRYNGETIELQGIN